VKNVLLVSQKHIKKKKYERRKQVSLKEGLRRNSRRKDKVGDESKKEKASLQYNLKFYVSKSPEPAMGTDH
jgi:hypothetical protein